MKLHILGCHSATPRSVAFPTSQLLEVGNELLLIDAGEGMQIQLRKYKHKFNKITHIFISHLHGDHFYGLVGFLSTLRLLGRVKPIHIYAPADLEKLLQLIFEVTKTDINYPLHFHHLTSQKPELILETNKYTVTTIPLKHRIYTNGFLIREQEALRKLNMSAIEQYPQVERWAYHNLKKGKDFVNEDGTVIPNSELTLPPPPPKSYAYCSDTVYKPDIVSQIKNVDLLFHEATFLDEDKDLAQKTLHTTSVQAAEIAKQANVKQLVLGHFSSRYKNEQLFKEQASKIFENTAIAVEGKTFEV
jgi:ribonuclease Z